MRRKDGDEGVGDSREARKLREVIEQEWRGRSSGPERL